MIKPIRRVVTGHNKQGKSIILRDGDAKNVVCPPHLPGIGLTELWETKVPASNAGDKDAADRPFNLEPPLNGTVFRVVEFPPDASCADNVAKMFQEIGSEHARDKGNPRHPGFHKTKTTDYAIVLDGEIYAMMDEGETLMHAGDVLVQRGTNHSWSNRTNSPCRVAFILVDAEELD